jgi:hypothetical protein
LCDLQPSRPAALKGIPFACCGSIESTIIFATSFSGSLPPLGKHTYARIPRPLCRISLCTSINTLNFLLDSSSRVSQSFECHNRNTVQIYFHFFRSSSDCQLSACSTPDHAQLAFRSTAMSALYQSEGPTPPPSPIISNESTTYNPMKLENILSPNPEPSLDMEAARALSLLKSSPARNRGSRLPSPRDSMEPETAQEASEIASAARKARVNSLGSLQILSPTNSSPVHKRSTSRSPTPPILTPRNSTARTRRAYRPNTPPTASSPTESRDRREEYEDEELAFIAYLMCRERVRNTTTWNQRLSLFHQRFPAGQRRRNPRPGMSETYGRRTIQGLQSKWYRKEKHLKRLFGQHESEELDRRAADIHGPKLALQYGFEDDMVDIWARL